MNDLPDRFPAERDPLDQLESGGELAGYVYRKAGAEGLRDLLTHHDGVTREFILDVAAGEVPVATTWHMPFMASSFAAQVLLAWSLPELRQLQWSARRRYGS